MPTEEAKLSGAWKRAGLQGDCTLENLRRRMGVCRAEVPKGQDISISNLSGKRTEEHRTQLV